MACPSLCVLSCREFVLTARAKNEDHRSRCRIVFAPHEGGLGAWVCSRTVVVGISMQTSGGEECAIGFFRRLVTQGCSICLLPWCAFFFFQDLLRYGCRSCII